MERTQIVVILVDDDQDLCRTTSDALAAEGFTVRVALTFDAAVKLIHSYRHLLVAVLVDPWSPNFRDGHTMLSLLSGNYKQTALPIAWTCPELAADPEYRNLARIRGAYETIGKDDTKELISYLKTSPIWDLMIGSNSLDDLTGLNNRRGFTEAAKVQLRMHARQGHPDVSSIIMADMDNFKLINDDHGHSMGDSALKSVARVLSNSFRYTDTLGRYSGDEFIALASGMNESMFYHTINPKMKQGLDAVNLIGRGKVRVELAISCGAAQIDLVRMMRVGVEETLAEAIERADLVMQKRKKGR